MAVQHFSTDTKGSCNLRSERWTSARQKSSPEDRLGILIVVDEAIEDPLGKHQVFQLELRW